MGSVSLTKLESPLVRQLRRAGLSEGLERAPDEQEWVRFLRIVNEYYRHADQDRQVLVRSNQAASASADQAQAEVTAQRSAFREVLGTIADTIGVFGRMAHGDRDAETDGRSLEAITDEAASRLERLLGEVLAEESSIELSGVRTNLVRLAEQLGHLRVEMREKARLAREMEAAALAQSLLVPAQSELLGENYDVAGVCIPAGDCGGDWWQIYPLAGGRMLVILGDVTGHGVAASVIAGVAKAASQVAVATGVTAPSEVLALMNAAVYEAARRQIMMTCVATLVDPSAKTATTANAGHHFPYCVRGASLRSIVLHGAPLGASATAECEPTSIDLVSGDLMVWFTDGVVDAENEWGEQFGEKRLRAICQRVAPNGAVAVRDAVLEALRAFRAGHIANDDTTLVILSTK